MKSNFTTSGTPPTQDFTRPPSDSRRDRSFPPPPSVFSSPLGLSTRQCQPDSLNARPETIEGSSGSVPETSNEKKPISSRTESEGVEPQA